MAKMSFEEYLKAREEYSAYLAGEDQAPKAEPEKKPETEKKPEPEKQLEPEKAEEPSGPDYEEQLTEIRQQLAIMAKALSPSLGDIQPVGIDDVVKKFFTE